MAESDMQRINIDVPRSLWKEFSVVALRLDKEKRQVLEDALREYVEKHKA